MEYYSGIKMGNPDTCDNMSGTWGHYGKWSKPDSEK